MDESSNPDAQENLADAPLAAEVGHSEINSDGEPQTIEEGHPESNENTSKWDLGEDLETKDRMVAQNNNGDPVSRWGVPGRFIEKPSVQQVVGKMAEYYEEQNFLMGCKESLRMDWVDYRFDPAYYKLWEAEANRFFRKAVQMKKRLAEKKQVVGRGMPKRHTPPEQSETAVDDAGAGMTNQAEVPDIDALADLEGNASAEVSVNPGDDASAEELVNTEEMNNAEDAADLLASDDGEGEAQGDEEAQAEED